MVWRIVGEKRSLNAELIGIFVYILAQLSIGLYVSRKIATEDDYLLAGRRLGLGIATFTIFATWFGAETCVGTAGEYYENGLASSPADPFGYTLCILFMGLFFATRLWNLKLTTLADLFRRRYSVTVERLAVLLMVPTSVLWAAAQVRAFGQVLSASSELRVEYAILVAGGVAIVYTVAGGMLADAITDLVQGVAVVIGLVVLLVVVLTRIDDWPTVWGSMEPERLRPFGFGRISTLEWINAWAIPICGSVVAQELIARVLACKTGAVARRACLTASAMYLAIGLIPAFLGFVGSRLVPGLENHEHALPALAREFLPTGMYVLFAGALVSAILSTIDSALLVAASLVSHNLFVTACPEMADRTKVRIARVCVVVFGVIACVLALQAEDVYDLVVDASEFGTAGTFVVVLFGLFTRFGGARSALGALLIGLGVGLYGKHFTEWTCSYLVSLAAAALMYVLIAIAEGGSPVQASGGHESPVS